MACKARGIFYKQMIIGRESAYGTLAHLRSAQGKHVLIELAWQANRKGTAFLGRAMDWRQDHRRAIAQDLCTAGHIVEHISIDGSRQGHAHSETLPDWLVNEEERLRKLEKQRQAGELTRPQKSAVDRSAEYVAKSLMRPPEQVDAALMLREAETQIELKIVQQKLARIHRIAEGKELPCKVVANAPGFIKQEAHAMMQKIQAKKDLLLDAGEGTGTKQELPEVECPYCNFQQSLLALQENDGKCSKCFQILLETADSASSSASIKHIPEDLHSEDLVVECTRCGKPHPWSMLVQGDGCCPNCLAGPPTIPSTAEIDDAVSGRTWRSRRRHEVSLLEKQESA